MNANFDKYSIEGYHNSDAENVIKSFELEPVKYLGIEKISRIRLGLIHNFILPYPCAFNTIAYYDFNLKTTEYLTLSNTERLSKFFTFSKNIIRFSFIVIIVFNGVLIS